MFQIYFSVTCHYMQEITIHIKDEDYLKFQTVANESGLRIDEKISEIIQYYIIIERNRKRFSVQTRLTPEP
jgi:hypothetical protein